MKALEFDLITIGRSSIDLYSTDIGAAFPDITAFGAYIGGSPLNIAVGARRLGLKTALLTAVGPDKVGEFILERLRREGVETRFIPQKPGTRSSAVVLGIQPPDRFPITFYRENAADIQLGIDDVLATPIAASRALQLSGAALAKEPSRSATFFAAEEAKAAGVTVFLDLDFRADQWHDPRAYGVQVRALLPLVDVAIGTEEEVNAAMLRRPEDLTIRDSQITAPEVRGNLEANIRALLAKGPGALVVKRGARGSEVWLPDGSVVRAPGFPVEVLSVLGAGDAFAAGFIYGRLRGWDWYRSARMGNACGAIVVTRIGCADFTPYLEEVLEFIEQKGGF
ncbi:5-dehydro-2-deoxygluconokinase [Meiothermus taiwanensis]|uniref:5-dehydro-2-deoxygluconokinase n=2 Tax=Meiothermus taiwanensis TaxID=172827 RepID=A0A399DS96_9DEIN|nr:5-dehydro-2-deoxygluconokinase [Meiothermus taiwanensis]AWR86503.1 5-dehydro-2-deoxygluconokinase [Meiothermus taiwanensis WR-220]KIQ55000.1 carbohydrate kinase [Meiothermus taiwanensis]KZK16579.1 carbohydrate kinase [Meiothermus taiwanensis]RIH75105.1 5-dehydro-2-deoxygluconokinase [Meiothermus taiwanensis]